jgi:O-antigen/teichoic acid export membrane protein
MFKICANSYLQNAINKGFFHLLSANFFISFIGFGSQLIIAKLLSDADIGRIKTIQSIISVATILAGLGLNTSVLKLCSENVDFNTKDYILYVNLKISFLGSIVILATLMILSKYNLLSPDNKINELIIISMFAIPANVIYSILICYIQALKRIRLMAFVQILIKIISILLIILLTYYFKINGYFLSIVTISYLSIIPFLKYVTIRTKTVDSDNILQRSIKYGKWSLLSNGLNSISIYLDILIINFLLENRNLLGDYGLATVFIFAINQITGTVQSISTPYFSEKANNKQEFLRIFKKYQKLLIILSATVTIICIAIMPIIFKILFPGRFLMSSIIFQILCFRYFFWSCYALVGVSLIGLGQMQYNFYVSVINVFITLIISIPLISNYSVIGAAIAQAISGFSAMLITYINFYHVINKYNFNTKI